MTLPAAAARTGSPSAPSMSIPLVLLLKLWMTLPGAGQPQLIRDASLALAVAVGCTGSTGVTGKGVAVAVLEPAGAGTLPFRRKTCPIRSWLGSVILLSREISATLMFWA